MLFLTLQRLRSGLVDGLVDGVLVGQFGSGGLVFRLLLLQTLLKRLQLERQVDFLVVFFLNMEIRLNCFWVVRITV